MLCNLRRSALIAVVLVSGVVSGDHCAVQLNHTKWKEELFRCLQTQTSVEVVLTESAAPALHVVCDQIRQIGQGVVESMITMPSSSSSKHDQDGSQHASAPLPTVEDPRGISSTTLQGQHRQNATLCNSTKTTAQHGDFVVDEIEYTATEGSLLLMPGANFSLVLPTDLSKGSLTVVVRPGDHALPQGDYHIRSYYLHAATDHSLHVVEGNSTEQQFCKNMGMPMVMYMRGFHMSTRSASTSLPCLSYYFRSWVLDDRGHFNGAMVYSFLLALLTQCLSAVRAVVVRHVTTKGTRKILLITIYTVQQFMGYLIMLIAMMYSVELLFAVVVGVALGNRIFVKGDPPDFRRRRQQRVATTAPSINELQVPLLEDHTKNE
jgi:hypothetical protein